MGKGTRNLSAGALVLFGTACCSSGANPRHSVTTGDAQVGAGGSTGHHDGSDASSQKHDSGSSGRGNSGMDAGLPTGGRTAKLIAATIEATCVVDTDGKSSCWGTIPPSTASVPPQTDIFLALSAQSQTFAGLTNNGLMKTFALPVDTGYTQPIPGNWKQIAMGSYGSVCALSASGAPTCNGVSATPVTRAFSRISTGSAFACGIESTGGNVDCWGDAGETYAGCITKVPPEGQLTPPGGSFLDISSGVAHTCGLKVDHTVACWGAGGPGAPATVSQCGQRFNYGQSVPPAGTFLHVAAGITTTCGIRTDGTLACWGAGTESSSACGTDIGRCGQALPPPGAFSEVAVGFSHACAIRVGGKVVCWGSNTGGRGTPPADFL